MEQRIDKTPAGNERFGASGAVTPQTILWELARYYPAASVVEAPPAPSRLDVVCNVRERGRESRENLNVEKNQKELFRKTKRIK